MEKGKGKGEKEEEDGKKEFVGLVHRVNSYQFYVCSCGDVTIKTGNGQIVSLQTRAARSDGGSERKSRPRRKARRGRHHPRHRNGREENLAQILSNKRPPERMLSKSRADTSSL